VNNPLAYCDINNSKLIFSGKIIVDITFDGVTKNRFCLYIILNKIMLIHDASQSTKKRKIFQILKEEPMNRGIRK